MMLHFALVEGRVGAHSVGEHSAVVVGDAGVVKVQVGHVAVHAERGVRLREFQRVVNL